MKHWILLFLTLPLIALAHEGSHDTTTVQLIPVAIESNKVKISEQGNKRVVQSNGIPDHNTGNFPNRHNPHTISTKNHSYTMPLNPQNTGRVSFRRGYIFGVALNGIPFDVATAEFYNNDRRSGWNIEAINGNRNLGLDFSNAHVQPDGTYHYHGVPWGMAKYFQGDGDIVMIGYAADGFPIYMPYAKGKGYKSSYRVKQGVRSSGPGGHYDGTYTQDWEYIEGLGDLDACNGRVINGSYAYVLTEQFPFVPRCFKGTPDSSFAKKRGGEGASHSNRRGSGDSRRPPHRGRH